MPIQVEHLFTFLALPANIRLGVKCLAVTNYVASYAKEKKKFITSATVTIWNNLNLYQVMSFH